MDESLVEKIRGYATARGAPLPYRIVSVEVVDEAERELGFRIPALLRACYLRIGNGGFGPGYGLIGVQGGHASDHGNLVETHALLKQDQESEGREWPSGMLPFCEWGCNVFSCVDCHDLRHPVSTFEDFTVGTRGYTLDRFFELWTAGADILAYAPSEEERVEITNPFTAQQEAVSKRRRR